MTVSGGSPPVDDHSGFVSFLETLEEVLAMAEDLAYAMRLGANRRILCANGYEARRFHDLRNSVIMYATDLMISAGRVQGDAAYHGWACEVRSAASMLLTKAKKVSWRSGKKRMDAVCDILRHLVDEARSSNW